MRERLRDLATAQSVWPASSRVMARRWSGGRERGLGSSACGCSTEAVCDWQFWAGAEEEVSAGDCELGGMREEAAGVACACRVLVECALGVAWARVTDLAGCWGWGCDGSGWE